MRDAPPRDRRAAGAFPVTNLPVEVALAALGALQLSRRRLGQLLLDQGAHVPWRDSDSLRTAWLTWAPRPGDFSRVSATITSSSLCRPRHADAMTLAPSHSGKFEPPPARPLRARYFVPAMMMKVLGAASDHQLAVGQVAEVSGVEPAIIERIGVKVGAIEIHPLVRQGPRRQISPTRFSPCGATQSIGLSRCAVPMPPTGRPQSGKRRAPGAIPLPLKAIATPRSSRSARRGSCRRQCRFLVWERLRPSVVSAMP